MPLWKLTPLDLLDPGWGVSSHRGVAIVRARDEEDARATAAKAFDVKTRFSPGKGPAVPALEPRRAGQGRAHRGHVL